MEWISTQQLLSVAVRQPECKLQGTAIQDEKAEPGSGLHEPVFVL